ncbi:hypothetical protein EST38_g12962, partial [Candolleomyces aberdarensis]
MWCFGRIVHLPAWKYHDHSVHLPCGALEGLVAFH